MRFAGWISVPLLLALACAGSPPPTPTATSLDHWARPDFCRADVPCLDLVLVVDTSGSTNERWARPTRERWAGLVRGGDARPPRLSESIWQTAQEIVRRMHSEGTAIGIVALGGMWSERRDWDPLVGDARRPRNPRGTDALVWTEVPLTPDRSALLEHLTASEGRPPYGMTHLALAIDRAVMELGGLPSADSAYRSNARKRVVILTDGPPTLPYTRHWPRPKNLEKCRRALSRAERIGFPVDALVLRGKDSEKIAPLRDAFEATGGQLTFVTEPSELPEAIDALVERIRGDEETPSEEPR